jgi:hypothetical protein
MRRRQFEALVDKALRNASGSGFDFYTVLLSRQRGEISDARTWRT